MRLNVEWLKELKAKAASRPQTLWMAAGAGALLLILWLYLPPFAAIQKARPEWLKLKIQLTQTRRTLDQVRRQGAPSPPGVETLPAVLDHFNRLAREGGIRFLQVAPGNPRPGPAPGLLVVPAEFHLEGEYRAMGEFLGRLCQDLSAGAAFVRRLSIERQEQILPRLRARVSMEIFFTESDEAAES